MNVCGQTITLIQGVQLSITVPSHVYPMPPNVNDFANSMGGLTLAPGNPEHRGHFGAPSRAMPGVNQYNGLPMYSVPQFPPGPQASFPGGPGQLVPQHGQMARVPPGGHYHLMGPGYPPTPARTLHSNFSPMRGGHGQGRFQVSRFNPPRMHRSGFQSNSSHHNHVDIERIREGTDVRTTVSIL